MSTILALTADIKTLSTRVIAGLCERRLQDLANVEALGELLPDRVGKGQGSHRLLYCREHKAYHLYAGSAFNDVLTAVDDEIRRNIRAAHLTVTKPERAALQRRLQGERNRVVNLRDRDRLRFSDWMSMYHDSHQVHKPHQPRVRGPKPRTKPVVAAPAVPSKRARWDEQVAQVVPLLTPTQRAEFYRCARKRAFAFRWQAEAALAQLEAVPYKERMSVYSCEFCSGWHMGHEARDMAAITHVDARKAAFALGRYARPAREFLTMYGIDINSDA